MTPQNADHQKAPVSGHDLPESAHGDGKNISCSVAGPYPTDIVHAEVVPDPRDNRKGRQGAALRRGTEKKRVRGFESRRRLIELHVFQGKRLPECARELGLSYGRTLAVWQSVVAEARGWSVVEVVEEDGISGAAKDADRHGLTRVETLAAAGAIRKVLVHEVSRVGRRPAVVHGFVERLLDLKVSLYWHSQRIETMLDSGKRNPAAGMMLAVLAEMALAERETLRERILSGLDAAKRRGRRLGRPVGTGMPPEQLLAKHADVVRLLRAGKSLRDVAARTGKGTSTVKRIKALMRVDSVAC